MNNSNMKPFRLWKSEQLERTFGLQRVRTHPKLSEWLAAQHSVNEMEKKIILRLQNRLIDDVDVWNEMELQFHFLGAFIGLIDFRTKHYNAFLQRNLFASINDVEVGGRVDFMVATGRQDPYAPFFFLHEYKKEQGIDNDPVWLMIPHRKIFLMCFPY